MMQPAQGKDFTLDADVLAVPLELSGKSWKIALHDGRRNKPALHRWEMKWHRSG